MKAVLISIQPKWCELIASRKKVIEIRKSVPKLPRPFKCYIYCTKAKNKNEDLWSDARAEPILQNGEKHWEYVTDSLHYMNGKVIGEFVCDYTIDLGKRYAYARKDQDFYNILKNACLTDKDLQEYAPHGNAIAWHISDLKIYDKAKELEEFFHPECQDESHCDTCPSCDSGYGLDDDICTSDGFRRVTRPPQSWCYVEEL